MNAFCPTLYFLTTLTPLNTFSAYKIFIKWIWNGLKRRSMVLDLFLASNNIIQMGLGHEYVIKSVVFHGMWLLIHSLTLGHGWAITSIETVNVMYSCPNRDVGLANLS